MEARVNKAIGYECFRFVLPAFFFLFSFRQRVFRGLAHLAYRSLKQPRRY